MRCIHCNSELNRGVTICPHCGIRQKRPAQEPQTSNPVQEPQISRPTASEIKVDAWDLLCELQEINRNIEEGNRKMAEIASALGELIHDAALLNFLK